MNAGEVCNREVVFAYRDTRLVEAAQLMRARHVGSLVVVDDRQGEVVPVGMITDRDIVIAVVALDFDVRSLLVSDAMSRDLLTVREQDGLADCLRLMREKGVRRIPVVTASGALAGLLTLDDLIDIVADELGSFVRTIGRERAREAAAYP